MTNRFIVIEGLDAVGKTRVSEILAESIGARLVKTPAPPYSDIRHLIDGSVVPAARFFFFLSSLLAVSEGICAALCKTDVVCDRYINSAIAYHRALGVDTSVVNLELLPIPDPTHKFYLTATEEIRLERSRSRGVESACDQWLEADQSLQKRVAEEFDQMNMFTVDTSLLTPREVVMVILTHLEGGD